MSRANNASSGFIVLLLVAYLTLLGCGSTPSANRSSDSNRSEGGFIDGELGQPPSEVEASTGDSTQGKQYTFSTASAEKYVTKLEPCSRKDNFPKIQGRDCRLDSAAHTLYKMSLGGMSASDRAFTEALWWHGVPFKARVTATFSNRSGDRLLEEVEKWLIEQQAKGDDRYGVSIGEKGDMVTVWIISGKALVQLKPISRQVKMSSRIHVSGVSELDESPITIALTLPDGTYQMPEVRQKSEKFESSFKLGRKGIWQIEILADGPQGPTTLANFPVAVQKDFNRTLYISEQPLESKKTNKLEQILFNLLNTARISSGLKKLEWRKDLSRVARKYSEEMAQSGIIAHISPQSGSVADRVRAAGIEILGVTENLARSSSARDAHDSLMLSPAHRANILHPNATSVGIGVSLKTEETSTSIIVTQVFALGVADVDPLEVKKNIIIQIKSKRRALGLKKIRVHDWLEKTARSSNPACSGKKNAPIQIAEGSEFSQVARFRYLTNDPDAIVESLAKSFTKRDTAVGIHVQYGKDPSSGERVICVIVLLGRD